MTLEKSGYACVNGLNMYYEMHGAGQPLVLLHGALSTIGISFERILPELSTKRQIIAIEQQAHGHTADIDRPLTYEQMADDTAALLQQLGIPQADLFGFSMGAGIALQLAMRHPDVVHKLVLASVTYNSNGLYPELATGFEEMRPEDLVGSPFHEAYSRVAPQPQDWPRLFSKVNQLDRMPQDWPAHVIASIQAPTLIMIGDSDLVRPEHAVELFRLLGGGVAGDVVGLPRAQLAVLPGTMHITLMERSEWFLPMVLQFLDTPLSDSLENLAK